MASEEGSLENIVTGLKRHIDIVENNLKTGIPSTDKPQVDVWFATRQEMRKASILYDGDHYEKLESYFESQGIEYTRVQSTIRSYAITATGEQLIRLATKHYVHSIIDLTKKPKERQEPPEQLDEQPPQQFAVQ